MLYGAFNPAAGPGMVAVAPITAVWFVWTYRRNLPRWLAPQAGPPVARVAPSP
jgi:uncharacterized protein YndB with AHSA1/START domain